ncbi:MAG TPA: maleylpyruvate isomerase family mycothiol-dependent enzyme [Streptosporangiaceae bacterium]|nr:maleylpyruvate isomerase family mycothiol-dependent enzyme [Streptosporangiaceae bacterium]
MTLDRAALLTGIPDELRIFGELIGSLSEDDLKTPSRCADWTVANVIGHVIGTAVDITQGRLDGQGTAAVNQRQAQERVGRTVRELTDELASASPVLCGLLRSLPAEAWEGPAPGNPEYTLRFAVEAIWYDAYLHGDDIRDALALPSARGDGLRCAVHHIAGYLDHHRWGSATLALNGIERIEIAAGGSEITGDPLEFVLAATGRRDPSAIGLDPAINVYADAQARHE